MFGWMKRKKKVKGSYFCKRLYNCITDHDELSNEELEAVIRSKFEFTKLNDVMDLIEFTRNINGYYAQLGNRAGI